MGTSKDKDLGCSTVAKQFWFHF